MLKIKYLKYLFKFIVRIENLKTRLAKSAQAYITESDRLIDLEWGESGSIKTTK